MIDFSTLTAYELLMEEDLPGVQSKGYLLRHKKSGARVMLLENADDNKVFHIAFRTTPSDSTGVAHIMEHTVLCGSRKYPSKDPFVELVKGSMNTFLNAMTYPDKTMFPVASCNEQDFANLMSVYLDAVFYPNIYRKEEIFRQEGWNYQIENPEDELVYNGVVYNEMKGAYSSPDDVIERQIMSSLFPDNTYFWESGGDPECIPDLEYEKYLDFHRKYYHPSNSYIYLYGNMDFAERLTWLDEEYLSHFDADPVDSGIALQKPFDEMKTLSLRYPVAQDEPLEDNTFLAWNVAVGTSLDTKLASAFAILEYVLLEAPGAPLKEALLDAGIGRDIMGSYDSSVLQPVFSIIAKNANAADAPEFLRVIRGTLEEQVGKGIDQKAIRAAINMMEFRFREADYGTFPKGRMYGIDVFDSWLYDDEHPFDYLRQLDDYEYLKAQIGTGFYEDTVRRWLLDNTHATFLTVEPERGLTAKMEQATREKLAEYKASLSAEQIGELIEKTQKLRESQETPSTQEELEKIPMLTREDMKKTSLPLDNTWADWDGLRVVSHAYQTNGIAYIQLLFDASEVRPEDLPVFGVLKAVLGMVNTEHFSYGDLSNEINLNTGGIMPGISSFPDVEDTRRIKLALGIQVRTLTDKIPFCFDMIEEILFTSDLEQEKRLLEVIQKLESRIGVHLNEAGSATASVRCSSYFSASSYINDCISGVEFYHAVRDLREHFEDKKEELKVKLRELLGSVLCREGMLVSYTGSEEGLALMKEYALRLYGRLESRREAAKEPAEILRYYPVPALQKKNEGLKTSAKVQYVARCGNFREEGYSFTGAMKVLKTIMGYEYLWSQIRVVGGAYGCSASFGRNGDTAFVSYRDPQLRRTFEVYEGIPEYLSQFTVDDRDMTKYVIGTMSDMDTPLTPSALGQRSLHAVLTGVTWERLQKERDEVLQVTQQDIRDLAPVMQAVLSQNCCCVLGNEDRLQQDKELFGELMQL